MELPAYPPARPEIGLAAAAHLELGLLALESGRLPAAIGSLACIDEAAWSAILRRFPNIPELITKGSSSR
jgi:hypothetical protein